MDILSLIFLFIAQLAAAAAGIFLYSLDWFLSGFFLSRGQLEQMGLAGTVGEFLLFLVLTTLVLKPIQGVVAFFMSRAEEQRTGRTHKSAQAAVAFTLHDLAQQALFLGVFLVLFGMLGLSNVPAGDPFLRASAGPSPGADLSPDWAVFRLGAAVMITALIFQGLALLLWRNWARPPGSSPRDNLIFKGYSGINLLIHGLLVLGLSGLCLYLGIEILLDENAPVETSQAFKASLCLLIPAFFILCRSAIALGETTNQVTVSARMPLDTLARLDGDPAAIALLLNRPPLQDRPAAPIFSA